MATLLHRNALEAERANPSFTGFERLVQALRLQGSGGVGFRIYGVGFRVWSLGFRALKFRV